MDRRWGRLLIAAGILLIGVSFFQAPGPVTSGFGGVILIGPIPIVLGSSPEMTVASMILALALMVLSFLLFGRGA